MPFKQDDATAGEKLLRLFYRLIADGRRHYQADLAVWLNCSRQTIIRMAGEIENVIGNNLISGIDKHRRWYQVKAKISLPLILNRADLRALQTCLDLAGDRLPPDLHLQAEKTLFRLSSILSD